MLSEVKIGWVFSFTDTLKIYCFQEQYPNPAFLSLSQMLKVRNGSTAKEYILPVRAAVVNQELVIGNITA